jgi:Tfp pilus assembly protein PilO
VITEKTKALNQLKENNAAAEKLVASYKSFVAEPINIISGSSGGTGDRDGDNARIVLDALPSKYDFPALAASLEKMLSSQSYVINSITGVDDEINQSTQTAATAPVEMPFQVAVTGTFDSIQTLVDTFQRSIRPITVTKIDLTGSDNLLNVSVSAKTYYQPEKSLTITTKEVR